ncbi:DALR anticodon-binding domain-containing protein [Streptomyces sp. NBC_01775]|uniref:DALR anticodon-binding domain-containing protein n=1 Tax=Streptomyces sp. NBC_01775 TaxID=2975939 RepID=UPI002DDA78B9|nr:DALR anticodon-binding domain-containing protein [Streptomyces sp. NBC_01775]WSB76707.1 DALR anticodon-binding domain-containing protein [Streptomyces sp. NBC_01775]
MTPAQLSRTVQHALRRALSAGEVQSLPESQRVVVESPPRRGAGDYATGVAFQVAAHTGRPAHEVAVVLCERLGQEPGIERAEVVGGGFVNVTLDAGACADLLRSLVTGPEPEPDQGQGQGQYQGPGARQGPHAPHTVDADDPARDIPRWAALTGEDPAVLAVRTERASSLFRVQYAHARARSLLRGAERLGFGPEASAVGAVSSCAVSSGTATHPAPRRLLSLLADRARITAPGALARHLDAVALAFADFHDACPPLPSGDEKPGAAHRARLALAEATGAVLAGGLSRLGVTAPAHI